VIVRQIYVAKTPYLKVVGIIIYIDFRSASFINVAARGHDLKSFTSEISMIKMTHRLQHRFLGRHPQDDISLAPHNVC